MRPEERKDAVIAHIRDRGWTEHPFQAYAGVLSYFDEHEPAVAAAIRYGLREAGPRMENTWGMKYVIDEPRS